MGRKPKKKTAVNKGKTTQKSKSSMKWYLVSFYFKNGDIKTIRYSDSLLLPEYRDMLNEGKHSKDYVDCTLYIDEFDSEEACKAAEGDASLVDSVFKIVEEDDKKADAEAKAKELEDAATKVLES